MFLLYTFFATDFIGKLVILLLLASSFYSISIIFKYAYFFYLHDQLADNLKLYIPKMKKIARLNTDPSMYLDLYDHILNIFAYYGERSKSTLNDESGSLARKVDEIYLKWEIQILRDIDNLSIIGSIAPFIGLFGTVLYYLN